MITHETSLKEFDTQIAYSLENFKSHGFKSEDFTNVVLGGLGGSGIGALMAKSWFFDKANLPIETLNDYSLPNYVNEKTLVVLNSYSGNTEETISAVEEAHKKGASIVGICSGGKLEAFCKQWNYDCILVPGGNPPRTQLAFSIVQLVHIFAEINLINKEKLNEFVSLNLFITATVSPPPATE